MLPDAVFPLKPAIQLRREHNLESFVVFVDLVKAFDTINHKLMILVLKKIQLSTKTEKRSNSKGHIHMDGPEALRWHPCVSRCTEEVSNGVR